MSRLPRPQQLIEQKRQARRLARQKKRRQLRTLLELPASDWTKAQIVGAIKALIREEFRELRG